MLMCWESFAYCNTIPKGLQKKNNKKFGAKPNVSLPGALSPTGGKLGEGGKISTASKSRGPNLNALAYVECPLST